MPEQLRKRALALYTPPFLYDKRGGYIWDAKNEMVADNHVDGYQVLRVRGWGRITYMEAPEELQDEVGAMLAEALTEYVERHTVEAVPDTHALVPLDLLRRITKPRTAIGDVQDGIEALRELKQLVGEHGK